MINLHKTIALHEPSLVCDHDHLHVLPHVGLDDLLRGSLELLAAVPYVLLHALDVVILRLPARPDVAVVAAVALAPDM